MPNWCSNRLIIHAPQHALTSFMSKAKTDKGDFTMSAFIPMPEELSQIHTGSTFIDDVQVNEWLIVESDQGEKVNVPLTPAYRQELIEQHGTVSWYDWALANWGTKWDIDASVSWSDEEDCVTIDFDTAWGPPTEFVEKLTEMFPVLDIIHYWAEPGMCFGGLAAYSEGQMRECVKTETNNDTSCLSDWHQGMVGSEDDEDWGVSYDEADMDENNNEGGV